MVDYLIKNRVYRDFIENVSGCGVFISTRSPFELDQEVVVTYQLPELRSPVRNKGVVVRKGREGIGVKFTWN